MTPLPDALFKSMGAHTTVYLHALRDAETISKAKRRTTSACSSLWLLQRHSQSCLATATSTSSAPPSLPPQLGAQSHQGLLCPQQREGGSWPGMGVGLESLAFCTLPKPHNPKKSHPQLLGTKESQKAQMEHFLAPAITTWVTGLVAGGRPDPCRVPPPKSAPNVTL